MNSCKKFIILVVLVMCLFKQTVACFRDPWMLTPNCDCPDFYTPCGVVKCSNPSSTCGQNYNIETSCGCGQTYANLAPNYAQYPETNSFCSCGLPACSSYRDTSNVCFIRDVPSTSCFKAVNNFDCGCGETRSFIYFPEVEYPVMAMDLKPFYYSGCFTY